MTSKQAAAAEKIRSKQGAELRQLRSIRAAHRWPVLGSRIFHDCSWLTLIMLELGPSEPLLCRTKGEKNLMPGSVNTSRGSWAPFAKTERTRVTFFLYHER